MFSYERFGSLNYFLIVEAARSSEGILLSQRKYTLDIIVKSGLLGARSPSFLMEPNHHLALATEDVLRIRSHIVVLSAI